jgi:aspartyl-tRNA(Asn)/glutamyl-tRNA(Gln) amidotransferase subunit A
MEWGNAQPESDVRAAYDHVTKIRQQAAALFETLDFVIAPTAPQQAFPFDTPAPANQADFTAWANFAALPATAIFAGLDEQESLPLSLQVFGASGKDRETLALAAKLEQVLGAPPFPVGFD